MKYLIFLQNAWSPIYAGGHWPRKSWLRALARSRSGQRLRLIVGDEFDVVENTTPIVGETPDSVIAPDYDYVREIIKKREPEIIIACGKQAEEVLLEVWDGRLIVVPHPAYRLLKNEVYLEVRNLLEVGFEGRVRCESSSGFTVF